ncbi:MAG TPA: replication-associated recombination protein A [Chitinophagaceae bacterium]|nr:replication-associated recombination protein A [Chitinophagaceae bacterium]
MAERLRPHSLEELIGQEHLTHAGGILQIALSNGLIPSMILWGPPGVGKTSIAQIIASQTARPFFTLNAINSGVKEVREVIEKAKQTKHTILFIDEIHRFNKSQQDALLHAVEKGIITLIGATTENPSFEVNSALLSRCQVYILKALRLEDLQKLIKYALTKDSILSQLKINIQESEALISISGGDARKLLNLIELVVNTQSHLTNITITNKLVQQVAQINIALYDKNGEQHYDIISAFIKSMRGSDPNAAVYWLARMLIGGEDVKFIARRMVIFASEDIGNANPNALLLANTTFDAVHKIGYPESRIILSQCAIYLATSIKSNSSYLAIDKAIAMVKSQGNLSVPLHIRNAPTQLMKELNYGKNYQYDHQNDMNFSGQEFLPSPIENTVFYNPGQNAREDEIRKFLKVRWKNKYKY